MAQKLSALAVGAKVKDTTSLYYGQPLVFLVADKNHEGYPANSVTLITEKIICLKAFDAQEPSNADNNRKSNGNNRYLHSNLRQWLNTGKGANAWYTAQHGADAPPTTAACRNFNGYDTEAGYLAGFSAKLKAALLSTNLTVAKNTVTDGGGSESVTDKIFLASNTEVGLANENGVAEGSKLALFGDENSRLAIPTATVVSNNNYISGSVNTSAAWHWRLRTPNAANSYYTRVVSSSGVLSYDYAYYGSLGVRPLCNLSSEILISDTTDAEGAYTIVWVHPPTAPSGITPPDTVLGGKSANISWGASTPDTGAGANISEYVLERAIDGGAFTQIYKGISRNYADEITFGWATVQYRVKAYDNNKIEGGYITSSLLNVVNNTPPKIDGTNSDLGLKTGSFSKTYTVTNPDAALTKTLHVVERINDKVKRMYTATAGATNSFAVTAAEWEELMSGTHKLSILATDNYGDTTIREYTFSKNVTEIEFILAPPLAADAAVSKAIMNISRQIPPGAEFVVEVCNNAFDASPAWEDVTAAVLAGSKFYLSNTRKTATSWGFNIRIRVMRLSAVGECFIKTVGGNFE